MNKIITQPFGEIRILENFIITEINEGVIFNEEHNEIIMKICEEAFGDNPYGYISNRVNSYSIIPTIYMKSDSVDNLRAIGIVSKNSRTRATAKLEKMFFKKHFEVFDNLQEAENWIRLLITSHRVTA